MQTASGTLLIHPFEENDPRGKPPGFDKLQVDRGGQRREHGLAASQDDREDIQTVFIDQPKPHEGRRQVGAPYAHVIAGLRFEPVDLCGDISLK